MGQYYIPVIKNDKTGEIKTFYSHDYDNGLKLMEHSYIGNNFVDTVFTQLTYGDDRLYWLGDYAEYDDLKKNPDCTISEDEFDALMDAANNLYHKQVGIERIHYRYIFNLTKREYIDLDKLEKEGPKARGIALSIRYRSCAQSVTVKVVVIITIVILVLTIVGTGQATEYSL